MSALIIPFPVRPRPALTAYEAQLRRVAEILCRRREANGLPPMSLDEAERAVRATAS